MTRMIAPALLTLPLLLAGCSDSGSSGPARPAARPEMTKQATHALSATQKLFELKTASSRGTSPRPFPRQIQWLDFAPVFPPGSGSDSPAPATPPPATPAEGSDQLRLSSDETARKLEKALSPNDCVFDLPIDKDPGLGQSGSPPSTSPTVDLDVPNVRASISGPNCPLEAKIEVQGVKTGDRIQATIMMSLTAKTPAMQQELRAKNLRITGQMQGTIVQGANNSVTADITGNLTGQGELLTGENFTTGINYGMKMKMTPPDQNSFPAPNPGGSTDPGFTLPMDFFTMEMNQSQRYDFGDSATNLAMNAVMKGFTEVKESYFINGRPATREEYNAYASEIEFPGMQSPGTGQDVSKPVTPGPVPGTDRPVECRLEVYDARQTPVTQIEEAIRAGSAVRGFPLQTLRSCQDNVTTTFKDPAAGEVRMSIQHSFDFVIGDVTVNGQPHSLYVAREDRSPLASQNGDVTIFFQCQPVVQCGP